ncbi:hypothetical protein [Vibrio furnissii]|uniref:hypothetical protein n=1 Tax=Vibrio furnissii TaxID=29494 RepID=UPI0023DAEF67|nr:hypothetical protein [Vibrio furnissii]
MELIHESHQVHFFSNNLDVEPNAQVITAINEQLPEFKWVPVSGTELNPITGEKRNFLTMECIIESVVRMRLEFTREDLVLNVDGCNIDDLQKIVRRIHTQLSALFRLKQANRLSVISSKLYQAPKEQYEALYKKLFTYQGVNPFEWDNRIVERKQVRNSEQINSISSIRRLEIVAPTFNGGAPTDVICVDFDSNTIHQNNQRRFDLRSADNTYQDLFDNNRQLAENVKRYF